jgi:hypothetical protein
MPNDSCDRPCPHSRGICRREFLKIAAATGLLVACSPRRQAVVSPTDTPLTPANTPPATLTSVPPTPTSTPALTEEGLADKYIAYCGYDCTGCQYYGGSCDGCLASNDQRLRSGALECSVRTCNMERGVANCGHCEEYPSVTGWRLCFQNGWQGDGRRQRGRQRLCWTRFISRCHESAAAEAAQTVPIERAAWAMASSLS